MTRWLPDWLAQALGDKKEEVSFYMGTERSANLDTTKGSSMFQVRSRVRAC